MREQINYINKYLKNTIFWYKLLEIVWGIASMCCIILIGLDYANSTKVIIWFIVFLFDYYFLWVYIREVLIINRGIKALYKIADIADKNK